jgi:hypothetical protein
MRWVGLDAARVTARAAFEADDGLGKAKRAGPRPIVMGLDQHRAQITAEWIDLATAEVARGRVAPADRAAVRRFLARFAGRELEVALEATTGWRFVVEELERIGAGVHLAEPAETSGLRGPKAQASLVDRSHEKAPGHLAPLLRLSRTSDSCEILVLVVGEAIFEPADKRLKRVREREGCILRAQSRQLLAGCLSALHVRRIPLDVFAQAVEKDDQIAGTPNAVRVQLVGHRRNVRDYCFRVFPVARAHASGEAFPAVPLVA